MKKNVFFLLMCIFAMTSMTQAQNRGDIQVNATELNNVMISQDPPTSVIIHRHRLSALACPSTGGICSPLN